MSNLKTQYNTVIKDQLQKELGIKNVMAIPSLRKIILNCGLGEALTNKKVIEESSKEIGAICGQKTVTTYAKKDISAFKVRKGEAIGLKVTLREKRMYDFFEKLVKIVMPRFRDFRGLDEKGFDGKGNFTLGLSEQIVFPEIEYSSVSKIRGFEINFVTSAKDKKATKLLLEKMGMPFKKVK
jgi:large subunit ribosomal protein L5